jgi:hypothetical protein
MRKNHPLDFKKFKSKDPKVRLSIVVFFEELKTFTTFEGWSKV